MSELAAAKKVKASLLGDIQAHLLKEHQKPTDRRQDILHPSEMAKADWCPRQSFYRLSGATATNPDNDKFSFALETIFAEGHEIHRKWQQWLWDMGRLWGKWKCLMCGAEWYDTSPQGCASGSCPGDKGVLVYREVPLEAEAKYLIAGHEDGADNKTNSLVEIKSIGQGTLRFEEPSLLRKWQVETTDGKKVYDLDGLWKDIKRPLSSHVRQTMIYLALCREMGLPYDKVTFLYEYKANQQVKAFELKWSPEIVEPLLEQALDVKYSLKTGKPPARPSFTGRDTTTCRGCAFLDLCYEGETDDSTSRSANEEPDPEYGDSLAGGGSATRTARARRADSTEGRRPRSARGHHGSVGRGTDGDVRSADALDGVHRGSVGSGPGRREVRRRFT